VRVFGGGTLTRLALLGTLSQRQRVQEGEFDYPIVEL